MLRPSKQSGRLAIPAFYLAMSLSFGLIPAFDHPLHARQKPSVTKSSEADSPQNLLTIESAGIKRTSAAGEQTNRIVLLADGDSKTPALLPASSKAPLEIVFEFDGQTVSPESLVLEFGESKSAKPPTVEILVSTLSPHTGFQSLRVARPDSNTGRHEFSFVQSGAKWIQVRIAPIDEAQNVEIAEIEVLGRIGPPATRYEFKESPAKALDVISQLEKLVQVQVSADERSLFTDARDGRLDDWSFAEAALLASGVVDRAKRATYLKTIDRLEAEARTAVAGTNGFAKGEKLLEYLHAGPLAKGYEAQQTDVSVLLDTSKFNCVSSATIYNILARRLGLDVRAIEVPDHAFSIMYDGSRHADVEATNPLGFNPSRDSRILEQFQQQTGFRYVADRHPEQRREIRETGVLSIIYYNHGVTHGDKQEFDRALVRYFCALSLDPEFDSAVKNALATLANWGVALSDDERYAEALNVVNAGLKLAPKDATLLNNRRAIWYSHIEAAMDAGNNNKTLALLRTAHQQVPDGNFQAMESWVFLRPAEKAVEQSQWDQALKLAEEGIPKVSPEARKELEHWRKGFFLRWSNKLLDDEQFEAAAAVLDKGLAAYPKSSWMENNLGYITQEWADHLTEQKGAKAAEEILTKMVTAHDKSDAVRDSAESWVIRHVNQLQKDEQFKQALEVAVSCENLMTSKQEHQQLRSNVYDAWARDLAKQKKWKESLDVYETALAKLPDDKLLQHNREVTWGEWADSHMEAKQWKAAADVYAKALKSLPDAGFDRNLAYITQEWLNDVYTKDGIDGSAKTAAAVMKQFKSVSGVQKSAKNHFVRTATTLTAKKEYEQALKVIAQGEKLFDDDETLLNGARTVYDHWALSLKTQKKWQKATEVYSKGLKQYPKDSHLTNNATILWDSWARTYFGSKDWDKAIEVYEKGLKVLPSSSLLKNNLKYCQQQAK